MDLKLIAKDAQHMDEWAPHKPIAQVPPIASPDLPDTDAANELRKGCLDEMAHTNQHGAVKQASQRRRRFFERVLQANAQTLQDDFEIRQPIIAVPQQQAACALCYIQGNLAFRRIARCQAHLGQPARQADASKDLKAVKRLFVRMIPSRDGLASKELITSGADKVADRQGKPIDDVRLRVRADLLIAQPYSQSLFHRPQVDLLAGKGRAVNPTKCQKEVAVRAPEALIERFVLGQPQVTLNDFGRNHFVIAHFRLQTSLTQSLALMMASKVSSIKQKHVRIESSRLMIFLLSHLITHAEDSKLHESFFV